MLSAGLLLHRCTEAGVEVLLGHMGGPFWATKDGHAWSIPKGFEEDGDADLLGAAEREFAEEMGAPAPVGPTIELGLIRAASKTIVVFARMADFDTTAVVSNTFEMEWPPKSGRMQAFPEIDRAEWLTLADAREKLVKSQLPFLDRLEAAVR